MCIRDMPTCGRYSPKSKGAKSSFFLEFVPVTINYGNACLSMKSPAISELAAILPTTEEDLPALTQLAGVIWRQHYPSIISHAQIEYMLGKMYSLATLQEEIRFKGIRFVRLMVNERFVGFSSFGPTDEPGVLKLHKCYLLPEMHGRGYGTLMLQHCEREGRQLGARRFVLSVNKQNYKALAAYRRNGFRIAESVVTDFGAGFVMDDFVMAKDLA